MKNSLYIKQTNSTNNLLQDLLKKLELNEGFVVYTDFQTTGKGQKGNSWESENSKNLLFSILLRPHHILIENQFIISQIVSNSIRNILSELCDGIKIKWPNDIYWNDKKIAGILIENSLRGNLINTSVIGIGLNVNQKEFISDAQNPVSLRQINNRQYPRKVIMEKICTNILENYKELNYEEIRKYYFNNLYRNNKYYPFKAENDEFLAVIKDVMPDGKIKMETEVGIEKSFYFKQVEFII